MYGDLQLSLIDAEQAELHRKWMEKISEERLKLKLIPGIEADKLMMEVKPSPMVPETTSGLIGWRSAHEYKIIMNDVNYTGFGRIGILKRLGWPVDGCP